MREKEPVTTERFEDYIKHHAREHELIMEGFSAQKKADDIRIDRLNELRQDVEKDRGQFQPVIAAELIRQRTEERLGSIEQQIAGMRSAQLTWMAALGIFFTLVQIALRFLK